MKPGYLVIIFLIFCNSLVVLNDVCASNYRVFNHLVDKNTAAKESEHTIKFAENKNQWDKKILYRADLDGGAMFLQKDCFTYSFYDKELLRKNHLLAGKKQLVSFNPEKEETIRSHAFRMTFLNALTNAKVSSETPSSDYCNYFIGNDKSKWIGNVHNYREVNYQGLYSGIDLQVLGFENSIKYNFIVAPGANTADIKLDYEGLDKIILEKGALKLSTSINELVEQRPFAYQWIRGRKVEVPCYFELSGTTVGFFFPNGYDKGEQLVIDPVLIFACSSGSTADNFGMTATYDSDGNLYSGGTCFAQGFPTTLGAFDVTYNGSVQSGRTDVVITKYAANGTSLIYSTYLGGANNTEVVSSLIVNEQNELMLYGVTGSADFPVTAGAYDQTFDGGTYLYYVPNGTKYTNGTDLYVAKFNSTGTNLLACTYIGGSQNDGINSSGTLVYNYGDYYRGEIQLDAYGNCYVASCSYSSDFPVTAGCAQPNAGGGLDGVIFKMDPSLSTLLWSTYLGGNADDACYALALNDSAEVFTTGGTFSGNFPATAGAISASNSGGVDGFVTSLKSDGSAVMHSTFVGTVQYDQSFFIQLDKDDDVYIVGQTLGNMPVSSGVYSNPNSMQFIWKMNNTLSNTLFTTVFGNGDGNVNISPAAFLVDYCENIYVSGWGGNILNGTPTDNMPLTPDAIQPTTDGFNFYLFVLSPDAASLIYATYFGGPLSMEHVDGGTSRFDKKGIIYQSVCAGCGNHDDFPVTPGSWPYTSPGYSSSTGVNFSTNCNNGTFKFDFQVPVVSSNFTINYSSGCAPVTVTLDNQSSSGSTVLWDLGGGDTTSVQNPTVTYTIPGTYLVKLFANDPSSCNVWDTAYHYITVYPSLNADFDFTTSPCTNQVAFLDSSATAPVAWLWNFDDGDSSALQNPTHIYDTTGTYNVQLIASTLNGCKDTTVVQVDFVGGANPSVNPGTLLCVGSSTQLTASGGYAYNWSPAAGLSNTNVANPIANPDTTTTYDVAISSINGFGDTCVQNLSVTVTVLDSASFPLAATVDDDTIGEGGSTVIHAVTDSSLAIIWSPAASLSDANSHNPVASPSATTTYTVTITDSAGCPKSATVTVYVVSMKCNASDIFVPNTFTPNADGKNDVLYVRSNEIQKIYFAVYDRWGELMFETNDLKKGWDGIYNGRKSDPAVFAWYLKATCFSGSTVEKKGNVTLIR